MAQAIRAILLASAMAATFAGRRANDLGQAAWAPFFAPLAVGDLGDFGVRLGV